MATLTQRISDLKDAIATSMKSARNFASGAPSYALPAVGSIPQKYDITRGFYNYKGPNTRIGEQGLSRAMVGGMSVQAIFGDSVSAGAIAQSGSAWLFDRQKAWPRAMQDQLSNAGVPANGTGIIRHVDGIAGFDSRWVVNSGTWAGASWGTQCTSLNGAATETPDRDGTIYDYLYYDSTGATFTISVDGTVVKTVVCNGSAGWKIAHVTGLNVIANLTQIKITLTVVGTSGIIAAGGSVWTPNGGLIVHNFSQSGATASGTGAAAWVDITAGSGLGSVYLDFAGRKRTVTDAASTAGSSTLTSATGAFTADDVGKPITHVPAAAGPMFPGECYIGAVLSSTTATIYTGCGAKAVPILAANTASAQTVQIGRDPDVIDIALGANDISGLAASDATITAAITTIRNRYPNSDCRLHLPHEASTTLITGARALTYQAAMYRLAEALDVPLYDWRDRVGGYTAGINNGSYGDNIAHLTPATESDLGSQYGVAVGGGSGPGQTYNVPNRDGDLVNKAYIDRRKAKAAGVTALTTVETVVLRLGIPAAGLSVADAFRYAMAYHPAATSVITIRVRVGLTGTTADAAVVVMSATALTNGATRYAEGQVSVQAVGASATILGAGTESVGAIVATGTATATSGTFDSTKINYVTVTIQNTSSTTTTVYSGELEWV